MKKISLILTVISFAFVSFTISGCQEEWFAGYNQGWPYPQEVQSVFVEMFDSASFRRDHEYALTDAICKQIEVQTPYKIIADRNTADSLLTGRIESIGSSVLATERESGSALEQEILVRVVFSWKNLKTGEMLVDSKKVTGVATYSEFQGQNVEYAISVAVNKAAQRLVESMQCQW